MRKTKLNGDKNRGDPICYRFFQKEARLFVTASIPTCTSPALSDQMGEQWRARACGLLESPQPL